MGTKNNPGEFDCYAAAEPDEPYFTLLARDKSAPLLTELWAAWKDGDVFQMIKTFGVLVDTIDGGSIGASDRKVPAALRTAEAMRDWRAEHRE